MKKNQTKKLAMIGMLGAISIVLGMTPLGFIPLGPVNYTIMHIPVIIGAIIGGPVVGGAVGFIFGLSSIMKAISTPTLVSPFFLNPLVSVIPRILIGLISYYVYRLFQGLKKRNAILLALGLGILAGGYLIYRLIRDISAFGSQGQNLFGILVSAIILGLLIFVGIYSYRKFRKDAPEVVISAAIGSLSNTVLVLGSIYILYARQFVEKLGANPDKAGQIILTLGLTNGIPEMILSMVLVTGIVLAVKKSEKV